MSAVVQAMRAPLPALRSAQDADLDNRLRRAAQLMRALSDAVLAGMQRTTELNWQGARLMLAGAGNWREAAERSTQAWRMSWQAYRVCSTTAAQIIDLAQQQARADSDDLWRALQELAAPLPGQDGERVALLQQSLRQVQAAQAAYLQAVLAFQRALVGVAQGEH